MSDSIVPRAGVPATDSPHATVQDCPCPTIGDATYDAAMAKAAPELSRIAKRMAQIEHKVLLTGNKLTQGQRAEHGILLDQRLMLMNQVADAERAAWTRERFEAMVADQTGRWRAMHADRIAMEQKRIVLAALAHDGLVAVAHARGFHDVRLTTEADWPDDDGDVSDDDVEVLLRPLRGQVPPDLMAVAFLVYEAAADGYAPADAKRAARFAIQAGMSMNDLRVRAQALVRLVLQMRACGRMEPLSKTEADCFVQEMSLALPPTLESQSGESQRFPPEEATRGVAAAEVRVNEDQVDDYAETDEDEDVKDHFAGIKLPGIGGTFVDYIRGQSHRVLSTDAMSIAAAIQLCEVAIGNRRRTASGQRARSFKIVTAGSSTGKNAPQSAIARTAAVAGIGERVMAGDFTSASALYRRLSKQPVTAWICDEAGIMLKAAMDPKADAIQASKIGALLEAFSHDEAEWNPKSYAKFEDTITVQWPILSALLSTTPTTLWSSAVTVEQVTNGFFGRFLLFPGPDSAEGLPLRLPPPVMLPPPAEVVAGIKAFTGVSALQALSETQEGGVVVEMTPGAAALGDAFAVECDRRAFTIRGTLGMLWLRAREKVDQVVLSAAFMRDPTARVANEADMTLSIALVEAGTRSLIRAAGRDLLLTGSVSELQQRNVLRPIRAAGRNGIARSVLLRETGMMKKQFNEALETLFEARRIEAQEVPIVRTNGSTGTAMRYRTRCRPTKS